MSESKKILSQKALVLQYGASGFSAIPILPREKKPGVEWKIYQTQSPTQEEIDSWWPDGSTNNVAVVTGLVSRVIVVDIDPQHGGIKSFKKLHLPPTYMVKTGGGGAHYYYRWQKNTPPPNKKGYLPGIDIQGEGAYVIAPPSVHPNGNYYEAVTSVEDLTDAPDWLYELETQTKEKLWEENLDGVESGKRNETAASLAGKALSLLPESLWETFGWSGMVAWNQKNEEPLPEKELRSVFESIAKRADKKADDDENEKGSIAKQIIDLVMKSKPILFRNDLDAPFARIQIDDHWEVHALRSQRFKQWATRLYYADTKKPPKGEHVKQAIDVLVSLALFEGTEIPLATRVTKGEGAFWYDLVDADWQALRIDGQGWQVVQNPPTLFVRYSHQKHQVIPRSGGSLSQILEFVNIADADQQLLFQVYLVSCFIPDIPHPVPILYGSQGSAKSTFLRIIRRLVDPSAVELLTFPTRKEELIQQLSHHWTALFDNVTSMSEWLSDGLCRAVTGEGFTKRELYTNDEDVIYAFRSCIALNGINICATKADLLDRSLLFGLERIQPEHRRDEQVFWETFEAKRPELLGAIFDALSQAIRLRPTIKVDHLPRMADFAIWGCAIAKALGHAQEDFLGAYRKNIDRQNEEAIHEHPVATAIVALMEARETWSGTPTDLLSDLNIIAEEQRLDTKQRLWPKAPQILTRRLNEARTNLETIGITIALSSRNHGRHITVTKKIVSTVMPSQNINTDSNDSIFDGELLDKEALDVIQEHLDPRARFIN